MEHVVINLMSVLSDAALCLLAIGSHVANTKVSVYYCMLNVTFFLQKWLTSLLLP